MSDDLVQFVSDPNNAALVRALIQQHMQTQPPMARAAPGEPPINALSPYLPY